MAIADFVKSAGESFRVGWKIESNWTDPVLFATYQVIRPLASLLIVAFIVIIGASVGASANSAFYSQYLAWLIVGNAFYAFVLQIMLGMAILVHVDRTRYEVLKNIYISPGTLHPYVIGRGLVSVVNGAVSVILTLLFSVAIFNGLLHMNIPLNLLNVNLLMLQPARHWLHALRCKHRFESNGIHPGRLCLRHLLPSRGSHLPNCPTALVRTADLECVADNLLAQRCSRELRSLAHSELHVRSCLLGCDDSCYIDHWDCSVQAGRTEGEEARTL